MGGTGAPDWIAVDWGTSNLRAWAIDKGGSALAMKDSDAGMGRLKQDEFQGALLSLVEDWLSPDRTTDVVACGMVGARQGWKEAAYRAVPCTPAGDGALAVSGTDSRIRVSILPGLMQAEPADVMRGEETQIAGYLAQNPEFSGLVCLPGTHSKWARVADGKVIGFTTFMTGELFALLSGQSVLRHSVGTDGWHAVSFAAALRVSAEAPETAIAGLFRLRAEGLVHGLAPEAARARLSGLLLGMELAATRTLWTGVPVVIIGAKGIGGRYAEALEMLGGEAQLADGDAMTLAGLVSAYRQLQGGTR
ncbi:2-dehydro-3-deoxygalactonokinase [Pelagibacterium limicola]|uniref:2-dehydro-3-deoxygalactonokinase n=1 Tax=Pelagibacterium limicola TaxID=2791022 RepID=UPI0018AF77A8|nr:2-dehydro-3-deoxygalactonokinase [Pelagibacterium limicola]